MEIQQLRHLIAAVENRNLLKAADKAYISQSGLSRSLKSLEHRLGVPLLVRGPKGVEPTMYGLAVIRRAKHRAFLAVLDSERDQLKAEPGLVQRLIDEVTAAFAPPA